MIPSWKHESQPTGRSPLPGQTDQGDQTKHLGAQRDLSSPPPDASSDRPDLAGYQGPPPDPIAGDTHLAVPSVSPVRSIRAKLVVPYTLLSLATAMVGIFIVTRLVASSVRERFANQLVEASREASDGVVRREQFHLEQLRLIGFTRGVSDAMVDRDTERLEALALPLVLNAGLHSLTAVGVDGRELLSLIQDPVSEGYTATTGADLSDLDLVSRPLLGQVDGYGDKYAGFVESAGGTYLVTSSAVTDSGGHVVGVLLVGTRLDSWLAELKAQVLADLIFLSPAGKVLSSTFPEFQGGFSTTTPTLTADGALAGPSRSHVFSNNRRLEVFFAPLSLRQSPVGIIGVGLPSHYVVAAESVSRDLLSVIFAGGTMAILILGYSLSQSIAKPLERLRDAALAVASGDLSQRTALSQPDEIGQLATVFELMTLRLRRRTEQAQQLHAEALRRAQELTESNTRLQQARQQLLQSEKLAAVGQLTAGIIHDVRNPLAVISGLSQELQEEVSPDSPQRTRLQSIRDSAVHANAIVSDLLTFARQSQTMANRQDLRLSVGRALRLMEYPARKANVRVLVDIPEEPVPVRLDAQQMEQVLINLVQNAIQAMPHGGSLRVRLVEDNGRVSLTVADTGVGIPKDHLNRIFDPFFTTKPEAEGTGLGLSVSYGIVKQHNGAIRVASVVGRGTIFEVSLPLAGAGGNGG